MSDVANDAMQHGDTNAQLRVTFRGTEERVVVEFEQRSGRYDGEHFAIVFGAEQWADFVANVNEFQATS